MLSNPAKMLAFIMRSTGVSCSKTLSEQTGVPLRTIQRLKLDIAISEDSATSANNAAHGVEKTPEAPPMAQCSELKDATHGASGVAGKERVSPHTPLPKEITYHQEQLPENITGHARALRDFSGQFVKLSADTVQTLIDSFPKLSFPGDLLAADAFLAKQVRGKIDWSSPDDRLTSVMTYLAKRNRETAERLAPAEAKPVKRKITRYQGFVEVAA